MPTSGAWSELGWPAFTQFHPTRPDEKGDNRRGVPGVRGSSFRGPYAGSLGRIWAVFPFTIKHLCHGRNGVKVVFQDRVGLPECLPEFPESPLHVVTNGGVGAL
jgi:hypothetical protein